MNGTHSVDMKLSDVMRQIAEIIQGTKEQCARQRDWKEYLTAPKRWV